MMRRKILSILTMIFVIFISITNVEAKENLFTSKLYEDIYKLSEQTDKIDLPFVNYFLNAGTYDEIVTHSGITIGSSTVDINQKIEGVHVIVSSDMVTIKGEVENAFIYANNIVVEGKISKDTILMAPTVNILETATVSKDIIIIANDLNIKGNVEGNVLATVSGKANISGAIQNDLRIIATDIVVDEDIIKGDIYIETDSDMANIKEKYPNAVIVPLTEEQQIDWLALFTKGLITVVVYSIICFVITRKDNNVAQIAYNKFKENAILGIVMAFVMIMLILILPIILILVASIGLGIIAWPILTIQLAVMLLIWQTSMLIVGMTIFEAIKSKVGKFGIPVIIMIFIILFALTQIPLIAMQANMALYLIAVSIVAAMTVKKLPKDNTNK